MKVSTLDLLWIAVQIVYNVISAPHSQSHAHTVLQTSPFDHYPYDGWMMRCFVVPLLWPNILSSPVTGIGLRNKCVSTYMASLIKTEEPSCYIVFLLSFSLSGLVDFHVRRNVYKMGASNNTSLFLPFISYIELWRLVLKHRLCALQMDALYHYVIL